MIVPTPTSKEDLFRWAVALVSFLEGKFRADRFTVSFLNKTDDCDLSGREEKYTFTNRGVTGATYITLPEVVSGEYSFFVAEAEEFSVLAFAGHTIDAEGTSVSGLKSSTVGALLKVVAVGSTSWGVIAQSASWAEVGGV